MEKRNQKRKTVTKQQVKQMIQSNANKEWNKKYFLTNLGTSSATQSIDSSGTFASLSTIAGGSTNQTRVGNFVRAKKLWANIGVYASSSDVMNKVRVIIFAWTDAAAPSSTDVLISATALDACYYNLNNIEAGKIKILYDRTLSSNYSGTAPALAHIEMKMDLPMQWSSSSSSAPITNALYCFMVSDSTTSTHPYVISSFAVTVDNE